MKRVDELNKLFTAYFDVMEISEEDKQKRVDCALWFYDAVWYVFTLIDLEYKYKDLNTVEEYVSSLMLRLTDHLNENNIYYDEKYLKKITQDIVETTFRHIGEDEDLDDFEEDEEETKARDEKTETTEKKNYWLSEDRAENIAKNEANTIMNTVEFREAEESGKSYKIWYTEGDERVRDAHFMVDGMRIPIDQPFPVGNDLMMYPHDYMGGSPENIINCRCTCYYE